MKCPHCQTNFYQTDKATSLDNFESPKLPGRVPTKNKMDSIPTPKELKELFANLPKPENWKAFHEKCPSCNQMIIRLQRYADEPVWLVYPKTAARKPLDPSIPTVFTKDYLEACKVLEVSPNASAALSRRCFQYLLHQHFKIERRVLTEEIAELLKTRNLPSQLAQCVDAIKEVGNFAAHPRKNQNTGEIYDVEPGEAEWLLDTLEGLFDFCFVQPALQQARIDSINQKLRDAGKKELNAP